MKEPTAAAITRSRRSLTVTDSDIVRATRQQMGSEVADALAAALEMRDPYTANHHRRTAKLVGALAAEMQLERDEIDGIVLAASLHDIGKFKVPGDILTKPGRLTLPEMALVQAHCQAGYDILRRIQFPWPIAEMVLQHHERLDGSGYPNGLHDQAILIGAKIIAVADVFESMTTHRPYRPARGLDAAHEELERGKGHIYDARAVDACVRLMGRRQSTKPLLGEATASRHTEPLNRLTLQQTAVMELLSRGQSVKEIARSMDLGIGTVKVHLSHAYAALGARNRVDAVVRAGLVRQ